MNWWTRKGNHIHVFFCILFQASSTLLAQRSKSLSMLFIFYLLLLVKIGYASFFTLIEEGKKRKHPRRVPSFVVVIMNFRVDIKPSVLRFFSSFLSKRKISNINTIECRAPQQSMDTAGTRYEIKALCCLLRILYGYWVWWNMLVRVSENRIHFVHFAVNNRNEW